MRRGRWYREPWHARGFERKRPIPVAGGIKADVRGAGGFAAGWARRWIEMLEKFGQGVRLTRGRSYARNGQVAALEIGSGRIAATVQGSRSAPYAVEIRVKTLTKAKWRGVLRKMPARVLAAAKLLAGDVGGELEEAFRAAGAALLPERRTDITATCTCPDWGDPCKHVAAVHYIFGAELERDPLLLFRVRGIGTEELLTALMGGDAAAPPDEVDAGTKLGPPQPLSPELATYFRGSALPPLALTELRVPAVPAASLRPLGDLPFWRGDAPLFELLAPIYRAASIAACALVIGKGIDDLVDRARTGTDSPRRPARRR